MAGHVAALRRLCARSHVCLAVIFGSRARGDATVASDLDLLVLPVSTAAFDLLGFEAEAQHIVGHPNVDITVLHLALSSSVAWEALRGAVVLWEETPGTYERVLAFWQERFVKDAPRRREQAVQLTRKFACR
jgi:predicted nucleotidyltransferase